MKKTCTKCGEEKELELFKKCKLCNHGFSNWCKKCANIINRKWYNKEYHQKWRLKNPIKNKILQKKQHSRRKQNELLRLKNNISNRIVYIIKKKGFTKQTRTYEILGCSYEELKRHLESQFQEGMNWDNYGRNGWHIDHIYPVSKAKDERHLIELNHYTNLQPLWEKDNLSKGNKIL